MLPERAFRRIDRARLPREALRRHGQALAWDLVDVLRARELYVADGRVPELSRACQALVNRLSAAVDVPPKRVLLRDRPRPHRRRNGRVVYELHGLCDPAGPVEVYTRTAVRARPVALRTLLDTLYHEWVHHWDFTRFGTSVHSKGFYERVGQLYRPSREWLTKVESGAVTVAPVPRTERSELPPR